MSQSTHQMAELIQRRMRQFLIHSFAYYKLDQTMITDHTYDRLCHHLSELMKQYPDVAKLNPYYGLCQGIENNGSGFYIDIYPDSIVTTTFRLLWLDKKRKNPHFVESFSEFIGRWGYTLGE